MMRDAPPPLAPLSRREFVWTSLAGSLAGAVAAWAPGGATSSTAAAPDARLRQPRTEGSHSAAPGERAPLHAALYDERFAEARHFALAVRRQGFATRAMRGDLTDLWYRELHPLWKERPATLAGLTGYAALFCLEQLAWDHRLRVVYRAMHRVLANGATEHRVAAPEVLAAEAAPQAGGDWPEHVASLIARTESRRGWSALAPAPPTLEQLPAPTVPVLTLHSWVIARSC